AVMLVVATLTFGSGLHTLVSHPALYGWNWDYALNPSSNVPPQALALLDKDPKVAAWSGLTPTNAVIDGQNVPILLASPRADPSTGGSNVIVLGVHHPAEIVNYRFTGATPAVLAFGLAAGAVVALGLTLAASVQRRRRDLALLKALGFTRRQVAAAVSWQASVAAVLGTMVGLPIGVVVGRQLWDMFARSIGAVPEPTVPVLSVVLVAVG